MSHRGLQLRSKLLWLAPLIWALASGCGWQLRGSAGPAAKLGRLAIDDGRQPGGPPQPLVAALAGKLGGNIDPDQADTRLTLLRSDLRRRTLASGRRGAVREIELTLEVDFSLRADSLRANNDQPAITDRIQVSRNILYDESQLLGAVAGEELARRQLTDDAADAILRRVNDLAVRL